MSGQRDAGNLTSQRPPLVLIIEDQEWSARALETILAQHGYAVLRAYNGDQGIERALAARPDALLIDIGLPDISGLDVAAQLQDETALGCSTPIILTTAEAATRRRRLEALQAGAWDFIPLPPDAKELLAKLGTWIRTKREVERVRDEGLLDFATGLYNARGLSQRAGELAAEASRNQKPLACVVFTLSSAGADALPPDRLLLDRMSEALRSTLRSCDAIGRVASDQFAVLAPGTDSSGAMRLAERGLDSLDTTMRSDGDLLQVQLHAGYFGVPDVRAARLQGADLLARTTALHTQQQRTAPAGTRIYGWQQT